MLFSKALLAKGLGGLALLGTSCASAYGGHKIIKNEPTKYDQGLIDHLEQNNGGDIKFSVKSGDSDISSSFPTFTTDGTDTQEATVTIKVSINTGDSVTDGGTITEKSGADTTETLGSKKYLKKLNGDGEGRDWTWTCIIKFTKDGKDSTVTDLKNKEKLVQNSDGFFNKLKTDNNKDEKAEFVKKCAEARGGFENLKIGLSSSLSENKIESIKEFKLVKGDSIGKTGDEANKLHPVNEEEFNNWFKITT